MADDFSVTMDGTQLEARLNKLAQGLRALPSDKNVNPLSVWIQSYQFRERAEQRPTVNRFGSFRGSTWPPMEAMYIRKGDGRSVTAYGTTPRAVMGKKDAQYQPLGVVTRAGMGSIRKASTLTKAQKRAGYGAVVLGQRFGGTNVLGKLKPDGSRYKPSDKQLGRDSGGHIFGEWLSPRNIIIAAYGLVAVLTHPYAWAAKVNEKRKFAWNSRIEAEETRDMREKMLAYFNMISGNA